MYDPYYSHGFLVPLISGYIIFRKREYLIEIEENPSNIGLIFLTSGLLFHAVGLFWTVRFLGAFSLIVVIVGLIILIYGTDFMKYLSFPILFLVFMVPIPLSYIISVELQTFSSIIATHLVNALGIPAVNVGAEIHLESCSFLVGAPCSGLRSIISLLALSTIYAYVLEGRMYMKVLLVISAVPIAIFANILRISSILIIADIYGSEAAMSFFHYFSGLLLFGASLLLLLIVGRCFGRLRLREEIF
ncbi:MAG: exosortase/archaeosortase family protein [Halobacteriota archaeon]|nr:exosortase/archaeosortase family protein [Halobacteriota archaeon]